MDKKVSFVQGVLSKESINELKEVGAERVEMFLLDDGQVVFLKTGGVETLEEVCERVFKKLIQKSEEGNNNFNSKNELEEISELELTDQVDYQFID